ncbi:LPS assembly lipoprotein LptE [Roseomonas sp. GC11]|uniref:LPS assembly lipoprotein LptE n=1 Tax=Roseomonas sp. GC11 TaxID=2950546 RepID=UPI00210AFADC|nr:LPS assembly lipoprotein LptE [Roseomonas sp. GC11]MCQ4162196.1 LPS assembly lipoprotein LptE [Roseomonas sp. GC11]
MSQAASSTSSSEAGRGGAGPSRRALLGGVLAALPLAGCGFRPVYAPAEAGSGAAGEPGVRETLAATEVALIPERLGQLLRRSLQQRLGAAGRAATPLYELRTSLQLGTEPEGYRRDGTASRVRYTVTATWQLVTRGTAPSVRLEGTERATDSYNVPDNQFFAADFSRDATLQRLMDQLAEGIVLRLSARLREPAAG